MPCSRDSGGDIESKRTTALAALRTVGGWGGVPLPRFFTHQGTPPPSTSRVGPTQGSGHGTHVIAGECGLEVRTTPAGAGNAHVHHAQRWSNWAPGQEGP